MSNKHFKIGAVPWPPFLVINKNEKGENSISGPVGDYFGYMQKARNCTFTIVTPSDGLWGNCNGADNCTGVIELVARKEVDFAANPFTMTLDRIVAIDYSRPVEISFYGVVVPLESKSNIWYFVDPFSPKVWILYITSIPVFFLAMGLVEFLCGGGFVKWKATASFVLRTALIEHSHSSLPPNHTKMYQQKLLIIIWVWSYMVLVYSYAGNLTAMLARPKLQSPIRTLEELLARNEVPWVIESGGLPEYFMSTAATGSVMKRMFDKGTMMPRLSDPCFTPEVKRNRRFGAVCDGPSIKALTAKDFSETGKCNYYMVEEVFSHGIIGLPIQANDLFTIKTTINYDLCYLERKPISGRPKLFDRHE